MKEIDKRSGGLIMNKSVKVSLIIVFLLVLLTNIAGASSLNIGEEVYRFQLSNFEADTNSYLQLDLGYGMNYYSGYGVTVMAPSNGVKQVSFVELEYQFLPESKRNIEKKLNYAFKVGGVSGSVFNNSQTGVKTGFVIEKPSEDSLIYLDLDVISAGSILVDGELGFSGRLRGDLFGLLGFKVVASNNQSLGAISGVNYGIKVDF